MLDLADYDLDAEATRGAEMTVHDPKTGKPTDAVLRVIGQESAQYRANLRRIRDMVAAAPEREPADEDTQLMLSRARNAAAAITGWTNIGFGGSPIEFSLEAAIELGTKRPWFADQVLGFTAMRGNFGRG
ncbi:hypothetical protein [Methylobacterium nodulans]|uniref:Uncharacterized protein n=1 Tax=Methylobacterium nodulans (strain LMG 21967 / CNCM I-2342 / ORS 2060) TaxID=460265 RepID=B8INT3_METNO|nr:hypothetical protein [Methylobacterium nodulans]ACL58449.1 conserved hypothetical protein [Methylobacterium nodulans ORS 2060]